VYDFALPPLLLHALGTADLEPLERWLQIRPENAVTVLDTHDGIGVIDAGPSDELPGLLDHEQMRGIFERAAVATGGHSAVASIVPQWATLPHQVNATFPSVVADDAAYLLCRAVQLFLPGEPQVYYVGLLDGRDDVELFRATGVGREVNRHRFGAAELADALTQPVPQAILGLVRLRRDHPAFDGDFGWSRTGPSALRLSWHDGAARLDLDVDIAARTFAVSSLWGGEMRVARTAAALAAIA
jgi:sucrose phosphorylase